jgi:hypothetical protein
MGGVFDLLIWMEANAASNAATTTSQKIDALERKIDILAQELHNLQLTVEASNIRQ